jgi:hypothetical protein
MKHVSLRVSITAVKREECFRSLELGADSGQVHFQESHEIQEG